MCVRAYVPVSDNIGPAQITCLDNRVKERRCQIEHISFRYPLYLSYLLTTAAVTLLMKPPQCACGLQREQLVYSKCPAGQHRLGSWREDGHEAFKGSAGEGHLVRNPRMGFLLDRMCTYVCQCVCLFICTVLGAFITRRTVSDCLEFTVG